MNNSPYPPNQATGGLVKRMQAQRQYQDEHGWCVTEIVESDSAQGFAHPYQQQYPMQVYQVPPPYLAQPPQPAQHPEPVRVDDQPRFTIKQFLLALLAGLGLICLFNLMGERDRTQAEYRGYQQGVEAVQ